MGAWFGFPFLHERLEVWIFYLRKRIWVIEQGIKPICRNSVHDHHKVWPRHITTNNMTRCTVLLVKLILF